MDFQLNVTMLAQIFILTFLGASTSDSASTPPPSGTATSTLNLTTPRPSRANKTICYKYVGCFDNYPPFDNAVLDLPNSPANVGTKFYLYTRENTLKEDVLNYTNPSSVSNSHYDPGKNTKFIIHGFTNTITSQWMHTMKDSFLKRGDFNVIIVGWGPGATFPNYDQAVANTRLVGTQVRLIINMLLREGGRLDDMHLIGHSLGAHTSGYTGRLMHGKIKRITGLDPAEPDFEKHPEITRLDATDAQFVDAIHTNGAPFAKGGAGLMQRSGDVDFYVNGGETQPGCPNQISGTLGAIFNLDFSGAGDAVACSHGRSHEYFTESILSDCPFTAYPCENYTKFSRGECLTCGTTGCSQLGYYADQYRARGKMYLKTRAAKPFCGFHYLVAFQSKGKETQGQVSLRLKGEYGATDWIDLTEEITDAKVSPARRIGRQYMYTDLVNIGQTRTSKNTLVGSGATEEEDATITPDKQYKKLVMSKTEVGDVTSVDLRYNKKKAGWLFGSGGGQDTFTPYAVDVVSGEFGARFFFCLNGQTLHDQLSANFNSTVSRSC